MLAPPEAVRDSMERARRFGRVSVWTWSGTARRQAREAHAAARCETREILYREYGYLRENRRRFNRERWRAMEAAKRSEGVLLARWGLALVLSFASVGCASAPNGPARVPEPTLRERMEAFDRDYEGWNAAADRLRAASRTASGADRRAGGAE